MQKSRQCITNGLTWREINGDLVVMELDSGVYHLFNATGREIWLALADGQTPAQISDRLVDNYAVEKKEAQSDVSRFMASLVGKGLLVAQP